MYSKSQWIAGGNEVQRSSVPLVDYTKLGLRGQPALPLGLVGAPSNCNVIDCVEMWSGVAMLLSPFLKVCVCVCVCMCVCTRVLLILVPNWEDRIILRNYDYLTSTSPSHHRLLPTEPPRGNRKPAPIPVAPQQGCLDRVQSGLLCTWVCGQSNIHLNSYCTLSRLLHSSKPQFSHLLNGDNETCLKGLL